MITVIAQRPRTERALKLAQTSGNPSVQDALEKLLVAVELAHGEELADEQHELVQMNLGKAMMTKIQEMMSRDSSFKIVGENTDFIWTARK